MALLDEQIDVLLVALEEIIKAPGHTWQEKRDIIKDACTKDDAINLAEFLTWFDDEKDKA